MTTTQKVIKILALALALLLVVAIFSGIISVIVSVARVADRLFSDGETIEGGMTNTSFYADPKDISSLDIEVSEAMLVFQTASEVNEDMSVAAAGDQIVVFADTELISVKERNGTLVINDERSFFKTDIDVYISITIPENFVFESVGIDIGAGNIQIADLRTKTMDIDLGAAAFEAEYLSVTRELEADLGTGAFTILGGLISSPDFDLGVGKTDISATIESNGEFDCGVGELVLVIYGSPSNYTIRASRGIGELTVNGETISNGETIGNGENTLKISGGIGSIDVSFLQD